jgi:hypothetical protein
MLPAIQRAAMKYDAGQSADFRQGMVEMAWMNFIGERGQEHWRCECAVREGGVGT